MTDETKPTTRQAVAIRGRSAPGRVTGKLLVAITAMVWEGAKRAEAARRAGLTDHSLRAALRKSHVLAHLRRELAVLREAERPRNVQRLAELRDQDTNLTAAVRATQILEQLCDDPAGNLRPLQTAPGFTILVVDSRAEKPTQVIDLKANASPVTAEK